MQNNLEAVISKLILKMYVKSSLVSLLFLGFWSTCLASEELDALRECGNLHHLEFRGIPGAVGNFSNHECKLKCSVGEKTLSDDAINEGYPCPTNVYGICHNGQCVGSSNDALRECGNLHKIDFHKVNSHGSEYSDRGCFLRCAINGNAVSANAINQGFPCPDNSNGICRDGHCVVENNTNPTTVVPHTCKPDSIFETHVLRSLEITVLFGNFSNILYRPYVDFCMYDHKHAQTLKTDQDYNQCKRFCESQAIRTASDKPSFNQYCNVRNGLARLHTMASHLGLDLHGSDTLVIKVASWFEKNKFYAMTGHYSETLESIYERNHQKTKFNDTVPLHYGSTLVGHLDVEFEFYFKKRW